MIEDDRVIGLDTDQKIAEKKFIGQVDINPDIECFSTDFGGSFIIINIKGVSDLAMYEKVMNELESYLRIKKLQLIKGTSFGLRYCRI